jgi:UDP-2,3-diacylglucosamine hydrolase
MTTLFLQFLREEASHAEALYILGDLFEAWIGDDEASELSAAVSAALRQLHDAGVPVFVMRGNRDFLLGPGFAQASGARLLPDPCVVSLYGQPTLLMHGDLLCSDDLAYQGFREQVRNHDWQQRFLAQSLAARRAFASQARSASQQRQDGLRRDGELEAITDANTDTALETMGRYGVTRLIHGHTHRPAIHSLRCQGRSGQRMVLGDWYHQGSVLRASGDGFELSTL